MTLTISSAILAVVGLGGIVSTIFLPRQYVWIGVLIASVGVGGLIAWAVVKNG